MIWLYTHNCPLVTVTSDNDCSSRGYLIVPTPGFSSIAKGFPSIYLSSTGAKTSSLLLNLTRILTCFMPVPFGKDSF